MTVLIIATLTLVVVFAIEYYRHIKNVMAIPIRIHVNGTRGKSSVTRLIAAGLRGGGMRVVSKTTGTMPRVILPDGSESSIIRLMGANIIEQKYIFRYAKSLSPEAIVIECMAVNPVFQWITETHFVRSTISVITNARLDHIDIMGATVESIAMCISNTIPRDGLCLTSETEMYPIFQKIAKERNTQIEKVRPHDVTAQEIAGFPYIEHSENIQLALAVCEKCGVPREKALAGMQGASPDPGALKKYEIVDKNKKLVFYNVFAANDPNSTAFIYDTITARLCDHSTKIVILNTRADRYFRSQQLLDIFQNIQVDYILLTGEIPEKVYSYALSRQIPAQKLIALGEIPPEKIYEKTIELTNTESHIIGIGNIAGTRKYGATIVREYKNRASASQMLST
jgi:poly-gamma-glutamate synthase PgsB/CapB